MVMSQSAVRELVSDVLLPSQSEERSRLDRIDGWLRWDPEVVELPNYASQEHKHLRKLSQAPWLSLVVTTVAQQLVCESVRSTEVEDVSAMWGPWQRNRFTSRQRGIHRAALGYGYAYNLILPGDTGAVMRGYSPRDMYAVYQDPAVDEYPMYGVWKRDKFIYVVDEVAKYTLMQGDRGVEYVTHDVHGVGVAPLVRYSNQIDLEGRTPGEVEPHIDVARRINKTAYDRMLTQHFNSWKVRTATNIDKPSDQADAEKAKMLLRQNDILVGEGETQFGTLPETPLSGFIDSHKADIETLAAISQTPAHALTGEMINLSADAITEARNMLDLKAGERKLGFGDSHCQSLRLAAHIEGRERDAQDFSLVMRWADLESRSMSQAADALGKISTMLGVPPEMLWDKIPNVTVEEAKMWMKYKQENPSADDQIAAALRSQANNGADG